jgi:hypothetical protein
MARLARLACAALALWAGPACREATEPTREEQLRAVVRSMLLAIPERDSRGILDHVGFDFVAEDGVDYPTVQSLIHEFLGRDEIYAAALEELRIEPGPSERALEVHAQVRFSPAERPSEYIRYRFELRFTDLAGSWTARSGRYLRVGP